jgi:hypothetical protein
VKTKKLLRSKAMGGGSSTWLAPADSAREGKDLVGQEEAYRSRVNGHGPLSADRHANLLNPKPAPVDLFAEVDKGANQKQVHHQEPKKHHERSIWRGASSRCRFPRRSQKNVKRYPEAVNLW